MEDPILEYRVPRHWDYLLLDCSLLRDFALDDLMES
jgi:hypothetical protein